MNQTASDAPPDSGVSGPALTALPDEANRAAPRAPLSDGGPGRSAPVSNPFASLKQEKTVEVKVAGHLLDIARRGTLGGDTSVYHVPRELLEMARRKTEVTDPPRGAVVVRRVRLPARQLARRTPLQRLAWLESRALEPALLRGSIATVTWLALTYAVYRLIMGW
jgi:hypothetical protein